MRKQKQVCYLLCIIALSIFGCLNKIEVSFENKVIDGKAVMVKKTFDRKGNILTEELLNKDSVRDGYYKEFVLGKVKCSGNYDAGRKEGTWSYWDLNGDLIKVENWFSGKQFGEQIDYYNRVRPNEQLLLYKYSFYNVEGQKIFESKYDVNKNLLSSSGTPLYCAYNSKSINVGRPFELICFFGVPEGFNWSFSIKEINIKSKQSALFERTFTSDNLNAEILKLPFAKKYLHTKKYLAKGVYDWLLLLQIKSLSGNILVKDSTKLSVSVQ